LKHQLDALAHLCESQSQDSPQQSFIDNLAAKNLELEKQLESLKVKSAQEMQQIKAHYES
jgi:hypothetical protein